MSGVTADNVGRSSGLVKATEGGGGKIGQVVQTVKTDTTTSTSNTFADITGMTRTITCAATSSTVLIEVTLNIGSQEDVHINMLLVRDSTAIFLGDAASARSRSSAFYRGIAAGGNDLRNVHFSYLDSPSSTSELTYKLQWHTNTADAYLNVSEVDDDYIRYPRTASSIICSEILA